jgi:hypothetical protein
MRLATPSTRHHPLRGFLRDLATIVRRVHAAARQRSPHMGRPSPADFVIATIADPELDMYLVSMRGTVTLHELRRLERELRSFERGTMLHLDVTDAEFPDPTAYAEFEALIESLEHRRVRIRIVGLRPPVATHTDCVD